MPQNEGAEVRVEDDAQKKAKELGIDPAKVTGTGQEGAVTVQDVDRAAADKGGKSVNVVTLDANYGVGEVAVYVGDDPANPTEEDTLRIPSGINTPLGKDAYSKLPTDNEGNLRYPLTDVKEAG